jgi:hypothetical protein
MPISLFDATILSYVQTLGALSGLIDKGEAFCTEKSIDPNDILQARLAPDMHPFVYQVKSASVHSIGAIDGVRKGVFSPDTSTPPQTFAALRTRIAESLTALNAIEPEEINDMVGRDMRFAFGDRHADFTVENFLLSFSLPNFYFHSTTAYDILRWKGVPVGKRDFTGRLRLKR